MSQRINLRFICYSVACLALLAVGVYFFHNWQLRRQSGLLLVKAQEAESGGNPGKAIDLYGKYLRLEPKDTEAQARFGSLLVGVHDYFHSGQAFETVLRRNPENSDVRRKAAKADMAINRAQDARYQA
jgi:hypothetical protein